MSKDALPRDTSFVQNWGRLARESGYGRNQLASLVGVSVNALDGYFQKRLSMAACQWLLDLQMADAYQQVATGKTLKEISGAIGFKPLSHLSKRFKEHFGVSPSLLNANGRLAPPNPGARRRNAKNKKQYYG